MSVCLSVCMSVTALAATVFVSACNEKASAALLLAFLFQANELELARFRALSGPAKHKDHLQDNLAVESCFRRKVLVQPPRNKRDQRHP